MNNAFKDPVFTAVLAFLVGVSLAALVFDVQCRPSSGSRVQWTNKADWSNKAEWSK